jgi:hypothetical protein
MECGVVLIVFINKIYIQKYLSKRARSKIVLGLKWNFFSNNHAFPFPITVILLSLN